MTRDYSHYYRLLTSPFRSLPDLIIPGEAKCGTTSLFRYLVQHPELYPAIRKEPNNFISHPYRLAYAKMNYDYVLNRYISRYALKRKHISCEASAEYFSRLSVCQQLSEILPSIKIVILLRNPVTRAISDYQMMCNNNLEKKAFSSVIDEAIEILQNQKYIDIVECLRGVEHNPLRYVYRGIYVHNVSQWIKHFPDNYIIFNSEQLFSAPLQVVNKIFAWLDVENNIQVDLKISRKGEYTLDIEEETIDKLYEFYRPYNDELYRKLGINYKWEQEYASTINKFINN